MTRISRNVMAGLVVTVGLAGIGWTALAQPAQISTVIVQAMTTPRCELKPWTTLEQEDSSEVLDWNQIFIDTLIATNTANSSSQRLGAIVHTAIFDAHNGIEQRYEPIFFSNRAPEGSSRRAAVIAAAYTALVGLFPSRQAALDVSYAASLAALSEGANAAIGGQRSCASVERGIAWGTEVAQAVLAWRATDGFSVPYPPFTGGTAVGQWRPTPPAFGAMSHTLHGRAGAEIRWFLECFRGCSPSRPAFPHSIVRAACWPSEGGAP